ncbi:MAG: 5-(carboxyamino)imidazole ribonucleotide synthase [Prochloraceae cyanobacterium]
MAIERIGVIGGGQLAWMMAAEAKKLGLKLIVQTPNSQDPAVSVADDLVFGPIDDGEANSQLADLCDVITFENEFIDLEALKLLAAKGVCFRPSLDALNPLLDKYHQNCYLQKIGLPLPKFISVSSSQKIASPFGFPVVLKARRHGYDGRGTFIIKNQQELEATWERFKRPEMILEEFIPFTKELAVIAARNSQGEIVVYPVVETYQKEQVCRWVIAPAEVSAQLSEQIDAIARTILEKLAVVGVFGIELFLTKDNKVLINELAPRTHNSGHYSLDACNTSQFAMQLRAVADLPLTSPQLKCHKAITINLLGIKGDYTEKLRSISQIPNSYLHWYGKTESRPGRKMGHLTILCPETPSVSPETIAREIESIWYG